MTSAAGQLTRPPGPGSAAAGAPPRARRPRRPVVLITLSAAVAAVLAVPLVFLLIEAHSAGAGPVTRLIFRGLTRELLWNTVRLTVAVTVACAVLGTAAAWFTERTRLPGRRVWVVLIVVPLAIPDFVISFGWASLWNWAQGFRGAVVVMTLALYPLVFLPAAASLRAADPGQEEVARSLGTGRVTDLLSDHGAPGAGRDPRRLPARGAGHAGRVRRVRDPRLPDVHHRDLHRVLDLVQPAGRQRAVAGAGAAVRGGPGRRGAAERRRAAG